MYPQYVCSVWDVTTSRATWVGPSKWRTQGAELPPSPLVPRLLAPLQLWVEASTRVDKYE